MDQTKKMQDRKTKIWVKIRNLKKVSSFSTGLNKVRSTLLFAGGVVLQGFVMGDGRVNDCPIPRILHSLDPARLLAEDGTCASLAWKSGRI